MSKLLLTSAGFTNTKIAQSLGLILPKPLNDASIALVSTNLTLPAHYERVRMKREELLRMGFPSVEPLDAADPLPPGALDRFDALYMRGGNTFAILQSIRASGFDHHLVSFVLRGGAYVGSSAGSMILGPDIAVSALGPPEEQNFVELRDTRGLNLVPFEVLPHFTPDQQERVDAFGKTVPYPVIPLTDDQAMLCVDGHYVRIG